MIAKFSIKPKYHIVYLLQKVNKKIIIKIFYNIIIDNHALFILYI